jgi:hypothetical protein
MVYSAEDSYKAYSCYLTDSLEKLFTNGKVDIFMNTTTRSAKMVIYNGASINDGHAIDCFLSGCTFKAGERSGECANVGTYSIQPVLVNADFFKTCFWFITQHHTMYS